MGALKTSGRVASICVGVDEDDDALLEHALEQANAERLLGDLNRLQGAVRAGDTQREYRLRQMPTLRRVAGRLGRQRTKAGKRAIIEGELRAARAAVKAAASTMITSGNAMTDNPFGKCDALY